MSQINESTIKTPGVYVNEIPSFPPAIAQVATAVPVFIGYTEKATKSGKSVINQAVRISSLVQYVQYFGADFPNLTATVSLNGDNSVGDVTIAPKYQLYNAIRMFYNNGGINCYIISVGLYPETLTPAASIAITDFIQAGKTKCFEVLRKEDEPTLIVIPDAVLFGASDFNNLATTSLQLCAELQDRFTILDVLNGDQERTFDNATDVITIFRNGVGTSNLNYGAAYYPWLRSSLSYSFSYQNIVLKKGGLVVAANAVISNNPFLAQLDKAVSDSKSVVNAFIKTPGFGAPFNVAPLDGPVTGVYNLLPVTTKNELQVAAFYIKDVILGFIGLNGSFTDTDTDPKKTTSKSIHDNYIKVGTAANITALEGLMRELILLDESYNTGGVVSALGAATAAADFATYPNAVIASDTTVYGAVSPANDTDAVNFIRSRFANLYSNVLNLVLGFRDAVSLRITNLELQLTSSNAIYSNIVTAIKNKGIVVPPSGAIAGIYAAVDGTRGVWKAPANVSVTNVIEPLVNIDDNTQQDLNVDVDAGKSINAVRTFTGKGTLVWGARTLDGNSNDFRYISVRRFYIMVEESVKKAAMQFVFEPNDGNTWVRIRAMIENYLTNLWRLGALAGPKPEQAFYVKVGLGQTMTFDDILNGKLIVEIGMAPVRPAEFIILRFSQIQQQA